MAQEHTTGTARSSKGKDRDDGQSRDDGQDGAVALSREELDDVVGRVEEFVRTELIEAEPAPGQTLEAKELARLRERAKAAGVFAPHVPKRWGGLGLPISQWPRVFEAAGYSPIGPAALNCMAPDEGNMHMISQIGTAAQKEEFLAPLAAGRVNSCFGMTEPHPGTGSDPSQLQTTAERTEGGWVINGMKRYSSGATTAAYMIVMAKTGEGERGPKATMFLVPMDTPGMEVVRQIKTLDTTIGGGHPYVRLNNVRVPDDRVLGEPHEGFRYAQVRLGPARLTHCMRWLGLAVRAQEIALERANKREIFGSPISDLGLAQELISRNEIALEASRSLILRTAALLDEDPKAGSHLASVAKTYTSEAVFEIIDRALQICGGDGVSDRLPLAQYLNEVRAFRIYDGATETHKWAIARRAASRQRRRTEELGEGYALPGVTREMLRRESEGEDA